VRGDTPAPSPGDRSRPLGSTGLVVSRLGLGLAALGRPAYINLGRQDDLGAQRSVAAMERRCHEMLDAADAAGIRYVDAARSYGMAEAFLASWLQRRDRPDDGLVIGSKWGYAYVGEWRLDAPVQEVKDLSVQTLTRQIAESRALLGSRLAIYEIHSATLESGVLDDVAVLRELARLRSEGLAIGLTVTGPRQADTIRRALQTTIDGASLFQVVQATWNVLERSAGPALAEARACGCGVIVKEALANGRLTDRGSGPDSGPDTAWFASEARSLETSVDALALAAVLSQPWADVVLSGAVTPEQLSSNVHALALVRGPDDWPTPAQSPNDYWSARAALTWQ
jgi:aryl-alcohol dehydrogenase-like predicted oxidoreductase